MPASHLPPETVSHEKTARALSCPALPCVGLHPGLSSRVAQSVPLGVQPAPLECLGWVKLSAWSLALSLHAAVPSPDERTRISLQALELSLPKGARPCWWLLHLGQCEFS